MLPITLSKQDRREGRREERKGDGDVIARRIKEKSCSIILFDIMTQKMKQWTKAVKIDLGRWLG